MNKLYKPELLLVVIDDSFFLISLSYSKIRKRQSEPFVRRRLNTKTLPCFAIKSVQTERGYN